MTRRSAAVVGLYLVGGLALTALSYELDDQWKTTTGLVQSFERGVDAERDSLFTRTTSHIDLAFLDEQPDLPRRFFEVQWDGFWHVPEAQSVDVYAGGDDFVAVRVDDELVLERSVAVGMHTTTQRIALEAGLHHLSVHYRQRGGGYYLNVQWAPAGGRPRPLDAERLFPTAPEPDQIALNRRLRFLRQLATATWILPPLIFLFWVGVPRVAPFGHDRGLGLARRGWAWYVSITGGRSDGPAVEGPGNQQVRAHHDLHGSRTAVTPSSVTRAWIGGAVLAVAILGLEVWPHFGPSRQHFRDGFGPEGSPSGRSAQLLRELGESGTDGSLVLRTDTPSSLAVQQNFLATDQWLLSLAIPEVALHDPTRGILANRESRGREWERVGWASMYFGRKLIFTTRIGVRVQGSVGRRTGREAFRLIFRPQYGLSNMPADGPLKTLRRLPDRLVVRRGQVMPHAQPIAFEISRRVGAVAPSAVPVRFVFNGALRSPAYELIEHVSREGWGRARLGHDDFHLYQYRASNLPSDEAAYADLRNFVNTAPSPLRMEAVKRRVDVENFVLHLFTIIYCGTADWGQGAAVLDLRSREPRWFWGHWDLDQSFGPGLAEPWKRPSITLVSAAGPDDVRAALFQRLLRDDPQFRRYFTAVASETINHLLTRDYLRALVRQYETLSVQEVPFGGADLESFFERRGDEVLDAIADELDEPRPSAVRIRGPSGVRLHVDGHDHGREYTGRYFHEQVVSVQAVDGEGAPISRWRVNGIPVRGQSLTLSVENDVMIRVGRH